MHNAATYLRECVDSILNQTFANFELLVVDDGSTDDCADIVRSYSDQRIRLICRPHDFIASLNTLLTEARGRYIARMDADDIMMPDRLRLQHDYLEAHPEVAAVSACAIKIDEAGNPIGRITTGDNGAAVVVTPRRMCEFNQVCNPASMIRRSVIDSLGLRYDPTFQVASDYRFWCDLLMGGAAIHLLPFDAIKYRISSGQISTARSDESEASATRIRRDLTMELVAAANTGYTRDPVIESSGHKLTLIIPFLNEGDEVENTVRSFLNHGGAGRVDIIVINDCSYDSYPYMERLTAIPGVTYILNRERLGVAASRDKGVSLCRTPYFLLLDAHMRAYDDLWVTEIPRLLRENDRRILCCQNKALKVEAGRAVPNSTSFQTYGARLSFDRYRLFPGIEWINEDMNPSSDVETIPAVFGAGYAASKKYWLHIGGLKGLIQYGFDEQMISLKTWLEGGECLLLKRVVLGHIYRDKMPYTNTPYCMIYNSMIVGELLMPLRERSMTLASACIHQRQKFLTAYSRVKSYLEENPSVKVMAKSIINRDFCDVFSINHIISNLNRNVYADILSRLPKIANGIMTEECFEAGLFKGSMGRAIWLYHYGEYSSDSQATEAANIFLKHSLSHLDSHVIDFANGLCGIGWGLIYLYIKGFIPLYKEKIQEIISMIDEYLTVNREISPDYGTLAFSCAIASIRTPFLFSDSSIGSMEKAARYILDKSKDAIEVFYGFLWLHMRFRKSNEMPGPQLFDWMSPSNFIASDRRFWSLSLRDGVLATSINVMLHHHIIYSNELQIQ